MTIHSKIKLALAVTSLTLMLPGCGGGSGNLVEPPVTPPIVQPPDLQTSVPTPTYGANSTNLESFNAINQFRSGLGLGLWAQNSKLDMAAQNHVEYEVLHHVFGHDENEGLAGFTGIDATARAAYAGYIADWVGEIGVTISGAAGIGALINSVYHRSALMNQQMTEVGIANSLNPLVPTQFISFSDGAGNQHNASDFIGVYPLNEQTNVALSFAGEIPNPFPSISLPSSPISIISAAGTKLKVIRFTITAQGSSTPLTTQLITQENDPNKIYLLSHEAHIVGVEPFLPNTVYSVSFTGTVNDVAVSRDWSFTTE